VIVNFGGIRAIYEIPSLFSWIISSNLGVHELHLKLLEEIIKSSPYEVTRLTLTVVA
jgi:hypothetical protein